MKILIPKAQLAVRYEMMREAFINTILSVSTCSFLSEEKSKNSFKVILTKIEVSIGKELEPLPGVEDVEAGGNAFQVLGRVLHC